MLRIATFLIVLGSCTATLADCFLNPSLPSECFYGLCYGPYVQGQVPGDTLPPGQIEDQLDIILPYTYWVRTYGCNEQLSVIPPLVRADGGRPLIGTWIRDTDAEDQIHRAFQVAECNPEPSDVVVIGNEEISSGNMQWYEMRDYIIYVVKPIREEEKKVCIPITIAEPWSTIFMPDTGTEIFPELFDELDGPILANIFPFHEGCHIDDAIDQLKSTYTMICNANPHREIWIGETGWPSAGETVEEAVPSCENAARYLRDCLEWMREDPDVKLCYFAAFDEQWKAPPEYQANWGVWYGDGNLKLPEPTSIGLLMSGAPILLLATRRRRRLVRR
ncbi:MAG: PEP-CTERM sorting domain-containing protein [Pirellulales bacterium]|nr:PEP-CTERM sorting domain-containing protein [Pirellulales bacterium]